MSNRASQSNEPSWYKGPALQLLVVLMSVYFVGTLLGTRGYGAHLLNALLTLALLLGVVKITNSRKALRVAVVVGLIGFVGNTAANVLLGRDAYLWDTWSSLVFFGVILAFLILAVLQADRVNADTVFAAACVYMLMGIVWGYAFILIHHGDPSAFTLGPADLDQPGQALLHFSFTTLTTVGYGSISPMSAMARMLSDLEAVISQLYLAVVIARLVSLQIEHSSGRNAR